MIIEQPEAFKTWLTAVLKPLCDADPAALAKYVLALIKKDKSEEELHKIMVGQLEVFLENETESFVNLVLRTLETQDYITTPVIPNANPPNPTILLKSSTKETKPIVHPNELPNLNETVNGSNRKEHETKRDREIRKTDTTEKTSRARHRTRSRSRSRSWERSKRSKSRERRDRPRTWRNKSPPRRFRRSRTPSPSYRRSRSRSPKRRYRNRTPSKSRSRSRSLDKSLRKDKDHSRPGTPTQDSNHGDMDLRLTNSTQSIQSVVVQQNNKRRCRDFDEKGYCMRGEMCPFDHGVDPVVLEDSALSSVLTYNPNTPSDVVPPIGAPILNPMMGGPRGIPPEYNPQAPQMWNRPGFRGPRPMGIPRGPMMGAFPAQPNMQRELIPVPVMDAKQPPDQQQYPPFRPHQQSNYPGNNKGGDHETSQFKKKSFDFNRLGPRAAKNPANCSLELKKIPQGLNSITHLNNHFSKFGKPVNIQVNYEGDPEAAIVTFSSHAEANAAYRSTEAVLNNRFIKVFWHNGGGGVGGGANTEGKQENVPLRSVKDRLGVPSIVPPNTNKVLNLVQPRADTVNDENNDQDNNKKQTMVSKEDSKAQATAAIKKNQELLAAKEKYKKNQDEKRKEVLKIKNNLRKRKQELLEKQLSQQKILIEKAEKLSQGPQRDVIIDTIKKTQESIDSIKKDLEQSVKTTTTPLKKAKEDVQREMLDAELDLITKQQEGADTSEIQKKLSELKARAAMTRGRGRGRRYNPVSRHLLTKNNLIDNGGLKGNVKTVNKSAAFQKHTVDHRPTRLLVSGYEGDEQESVLNHFQHFGEIANYTTDSTLPSITLTYKTRKEAEMAMLKGKHFQDRTLSITWCTTPSANNQINARPASRKVLMSETEEDRLIDQNLLEGEEELGPEISEEALLQDDEEEEEENEDRSWRR